MAEMKEDLQTNSVEQDEVLKQNGITINNKKKKVMAIKEEQCDLKTYGWKEILLSMLMNSNMWK